MSSQGSATPSQNKGARRPGAGDETHLPASKADSMAPAARGLKYAESRWVSGGMNRA
jgi:hypothetical protein